MFYSDSRIMTRVFLRDQNLIGKDFIWHPVSVYPILIILRSDNACKNNNYSHKDVVIIIPKNLSRKPPKTNKEIFCNSWVVGDSNFLLDFAHFEEHLWSEYKKFIFWRLVVESFHAKWLSSLEYILQWCYWSSTSGHPDLSGCL